MKAFWGFVQVVSIVGMVVAIIACFVNLIIGGILLILSFSVAKTAGREIKHIEMLEAIRKGKSE